MRLCARVACAGELRGFELTHFRAAGNLARCQVVPLDLFQKNAEQMLRDRTRLDPFLSQVALFLPALMAELA